LLRKMFHLAQDAQDVCRLDQDAHSLAQAVSPGPPKTLDSHLCSAKGNIYCSIYNIFILIRHYIEISALPRQAASQSHTVPSFLSRSRYNLKGIKVSTPRERKRSNAHTKDGIIAEVLNEGTKR
jgi:hypothetical protein